MLVLSRKRGEKIVFNDGEISLMVVDIRGGVVRIGIDAPDEMPIYRAELYREMQREYDQELRRSRRNAD